MLFNQIEFVVFFTIVFGLIFVVSNNRWRKYILLLSSYYFYGYWDWRFLGLILGSTLVDYFVGLRIYKTEKRQYRNLFLSISLVFNLGMLFFFKYCNFFIDSLSAVLSPLGLNVSSLNIILPVGISFYTFQTLSYTIDIYRRRIKPCHHFFDFGLFVSFFPQLVAGPIVRASEFLPQLETKRTLNYTRFFYGFRQFVYGFFKKVFIADRLALFVDHVFDNPSVFDGLTMWIAVIAYSIQIYCDFSGYSDMAIGSARILGYDLNRNFNFPYIANNIEDFWRRWHISLSSWLRDYLYIPLGGNRKGPKWTYVNLILTMLLGGLWHGASWTFVFWGGIHGVTLAIFKYYKGLLRDRKGEYALSAQRKLYGWILTMVIVTIGWVFFRSKSVELAFEMLEHMFVNLSGISWFSPFVISVILLMILRHLIVVMGFTQHFDLTIEKRHSLILILTLLWISIIFYPKGFQPFTYFQF